MLSHVGSFTNIRGGHVYPALIRKTDAQADPRLPAGRLATTWTTPTATGRWPISRWPRRLKFADYDYHFEYGDGGHNGKHGGAILPDSLRWLWKDVVEARAKN